MRLLIYHECIKSPFFTHPMNKNYFYLSIWYFFSEIIYHVQKKRSSELVSVTHIFSAVNMAVNRILTWCRITIPL